MNFDDSIPTDSVHVRFSSRNGRFRNHRMRNGLAPVEMAIALPFLMLFMASIIAFGYAASWKIRSEVVARDVGWRNRFPRWANANARAVEWPEPATMNRYAGPPLSNLDEDRVTEAPIIVGPLPQVNVNSNTLDLTRDVVVGNAQVTRRPPVLPRLGEISYDTEHPYLDDQFTHSEMGISNYSRRIPIIYETDLDFILDSVGIRNAVSAIVNNRYRGLLMALEDDVEFIAWYGSAPDFHPRISIRNYQLDRAWVRRNRVERLLTSIDRLPQTMVSATISLYRTQLNTEPPLPMNVQNELDRKIRELEQYLDRLRARAGERQNGPVAQNIQRLEPR